MECGRSVISGTAHLPPLDWFSLDYLKLVNLTADNIQFWRCVEMKKIIIINK